jgi:hypothetical protein
MTKQADNTDISDAERNTPFDIADDMEDDVMSLIDCGHIIVRVADTLDDEDVRVVSRLGYLIVELAESVQRRQCLIFDALHPNRAELDAEAKAHERTED